MTSEIIHYGIPGQKWGVRRTPEQLGRKTTSKNKKERYHEDYRKTHDKKRLSEMSDSELRERLNRLNMERQYRQMNPSRIKRGRDALNTGLAVIGAVSATAGVVIKLKNQHDVIRAWFQ